MEEGSIADILSENNPVLFTQIDQPPQSSQTKHRFFSESPIAIFDSPPKKKEREIDSRQSTLSHQIEYQNFPENLLFYTVNSIPYVDSPPLLIYHTFEKILEDDTSNSIQKRLFPNYEKLKCKICQNDQPAVSFGCSNKNCLSKFHLECSEKNPSISRSDLEKRQNEKKDLIEQTINFPFEEEYCEKCDTEVLPPKFCDECFQKHYKVHEIYCKNCIKHSRQKSHLLRYERDNENIDLTWNRFIEYVFQPCSLRFIINTYWYILLTEFKDDEERRHFKKSLEMKVVFDRIAENFFFLTEQVRVYHCSTFFMAYFEVAGLIIFHLLKTSFPNDLGKLEKKFREKLVKKLERWTRDNEKQAQTQISNKDKNKNIKENIDNVTKNQKDFEKNMDFDNLSSYSSNQNPKDPSIPLFVVRTKTKIGHSKLIDYQLKKMNVKSVWTFPLLFSSSKDDEEYYSSEDDFNCAKSNAPIECGELKKQKEQYDYFVRVLNSQKEKNEELHRQNQEKKKVIDHETKLRNKIIATSKIHKPSIEAHDPKHCKWYLSNEEIFEKEKCGLPINSLSDPYEVRPLSPTFIQAMFKPVRDAENEMKSQALSKMNKPCTVDSSKWQDIIDIHNVSEHFKYDYTYRPKSYFSLSNSL